MRRLVAIAALLAGCSGYTGSPGSNGSTSITTLGAVTTGQWTATPIAVAYGGTGTSSAGGAAVDAISGFASTGFLKRTGSATYSFIADPLPLVNGGTGTAAASNTAAFDALAPASPTTGDILYYSAGHWTKLAAGAAGTVITGNGAGVAPTYQAAGGGCVGWAQCECQTLIANAGLTNATATCIVDEIDGQSSVAWDCSIGGSGTVTALDAVGVQLDTTATSGRSSRCDRKHVTGSNVTYSVNTVKASGANYGFACRVAFPTGAIAGTAQGQIGVVNAGSDQFSIGVNASFSTSKFACAVANAGGSSHANSSISIDSSTHTVRAWDDGAVQNCQLDAETAFSVGTRRVPGAGEYGFMYQDNAGSAVNYGLQVDACVYVRTK